MPPAAVDGRPQHGTGAALGVGPIAGYGVPPPGRSPLRETPMSSSASSVARASSLAARAVGRKLPRASLATHPLRTSAATLRRVVSRGMPVYCAIDRVLMLGVQVASVKPNVS